MVELNRRALIQLSLAGMLTATASPALAATSLKNGIDISWLPNYESAGGKFYTAAGKPTTVFDLMKLSGVRVVRIRVFVNPNYRNGKLSDAIALASRAKDAGLDVCLDLHFSDDWADPGHQQTPAGWSTTNIDVLAGQVQSYVARTLTEFKNRSIPLAYVQLGNEISNGMLWPLGRIDGNNSVQWKNLAKIFNAATSALRQIMPSAKNLLHLDCSGDSNRLRWWLMNASYYWIRDYNIVGLSYYPQWHGGLKSLTETLEVVAWEFEKPVILAETAYPYTWSTFGNDVINPAKSVLPGYALTASGQANYLKKLNTIMKGLSYGNGLGVWWWEGMVPRVLANGQVIWDSGMTNSTLVDETGKALAALAAMKG